MSSAKRRALIWRPSAFSASLVANPYGVGWAYSIVTNPTIHRIHPDVKLQLQRLRLRSITRHLRGVGEALCYGVEQFGPTHLKLV